MQFITRAYNNIDLDESRGVIKKSSSEDRIRQELNYYQCVPEHLQCYFPRIFKFEHLKDHTYFEQEFFGYPNLGSVFTGNTGFNWEKISRNILSVLSDFSKTSKTTKEASDYRHQMFIKKTEKEYSNLVENFSFFSSLSSNDTLEINGKKYSNFERIWPDAAKIITEDIVHAGEFSVIHGDMCFSNILCHPETGVVRLIDPRGAFGEAGIYGDPIYDAAKLLHSTVGKYESIIYDNFTLSTTNKKIDFKHRDSLGSKLENFTQEICDRFDKKKALLIMSTIFIGMCARHYDSQDRQAVMYATGIKFMHEALEA